MERWPPVGRGGESQPPSHPSLTEDNHHNDGDDNYDRFTLSAISATVTPSAFSPSLIFTSAPLMMIIMILMMMMMIMMRMMMIMMMMMMMIMMMMMMIMMIMMMMMMIYI